MAAQRDRARSFFPTPLADVLDQCLAPALAAQGFAAADIIVAWAEIVGPRLAAYSQPLRVQWPRDNNNVGISGPATLVVRTASAFAPELQHMAPVVIDRVNTHFGWRCIGRIVIKQGPVVAPHRRRTPVAIDPAATTAAQGLTAGVTDDALRQALTRLGEAVLTQRKRTADHT